MQFFSSGKLPMTTSVLTAQIILRADTQHAEYQDILEIYLIS